MQQDFSIPTRDGLTRLKGDVMLPDGWRPADGALLIVPGGWFTERDGFTGDSYTEADLMYLRIARRVCAAGVLVARYDNRGVTGNELSLGLTQDSSDPAADTARYLRACVDSEVRRSVSPESLSADTTSVFRYVAGHYGVEPSAVVVFAHSEGGLHTARAIGSGDIDPKGVVVAGTPLQSPAASMRWQMVDRCVEEVMRWDCDGNARVSAGEVAAAFGASFLAEMGLSEQELQPPQGAWSEPELAAFFTGRYEQEKRAALRAPDDAPYPPTGDTAPTASAFVAASSRWFKQWFSDDTPTLSLLRDYRGRVALHYGEIDRQLSASREAACLKTWPDRLACDPEVLVHPSCGHAFGESKPVAGPMRRGSEDALVQAITAVLREA